MAIHGLKSMRANTLQRTLIIYFLLIGFAALLVTMEFLVDMRDEELKKALVLGFNQYFQGNVTLAEVFAPLDHLTDKVLLMIGIILFEVVIVLTMFIKNIVGPLQHMIDVSRELSTGNLERTVNVHTANELAVLGNVINEMASNLQEIILFSRNMCVTGDEQIAAISATLSREEIGAAEIEQMKSQIDKMRQQHELLREFVGHFSFFEIDDANK